MQKGDIVVSTIYNYLKPIKLLCEINDINIKCKKNHHWASKGEKVCRGQGAYYRRNTEARSVSC